MALRVGLAQAKAAGRWHHRTLPALPAVPHLAEATEATEATRFDGIKSQFYG